MRNQLRPFSAVAGNLGQVDFELVVEHLEALDLTAQERGLIWNALRDVVARHRLYQTTDWAIPADAVGRLERLMERFLPDDPTTRFGWLFSWDATLDDTGSYDAEDLETQQRRIDERRRKAISTILGDAGIDGVVALARSVKEPGMVGWALGATPEGRDCEDRILTDYLRGEDDALHAMASGFARFQSDRDSISWIQDKLEGVGSSWPGSRQAALLHAMQPSAAVWRLATELGKDASTHYWADVRIHWIPPPDRAQAAAELTSVGRAAAAVELLALQDKADSPESDLVIKVLAAVPEQGLGPDDHRSTHFAYAAARLLSMLAERSVPDEVLGRLEWGLLPVVDRFERHPHALTRLLQRDPDFFVEIVSRAFRGEDEEPTELAELEIQQARNAYRLLHDWRTIPGQDGGQVDADALNGWVDRARAALSERHRLEVGDMTLGEVLSGSPSDPDGTWPTTAVRDLIERLESAELEEGLRLGVYNSRGVTVRDPLEGGSLERGLAQRYEGLASAVVSAWPRTADILRQLANEYYAEARQEDVSAGVREDLGL